MKAGDAHRRLLRLMPSAQDGVIAVVAAGLAVAVLLIAQTLLLSWIVRDVLFRHARLDDVMPLLALAACVMVGRAALIGLREVVARRTAIRVKMELRARLAEHLLHLGPAYVTGERTGELVATATEGIEKLDAYVSRYLPQTVLAAAVPLAIVLAILPVDPLSAGLLIFTVPVIVLLMILIGTFTRDHVQRQWEALGRLSSAFLDIIQGLPTLVLLDRDGGERRRVETISERFRDRTLSVLKVAFISGAVLELMTAAGIGLIATVLGVRLLDGSIPFDRAFFVFLLTPEFYRPLRDLGTHRHAMIEGSAAAERMLEILQTPGVEAVATMSDHDDAGESRCHPRSVGATPASGYPIHPRRPSGMFVGETDECNSPLRHPDGHNSPPYSPNSVSAFGRSGSEDREGLAIELDDVSYIYPEREIPALTQVTLSLPPGTCTAVVGRSGSGKSTLVNLLLRTMDPLEGTIRANGVPLSALPLERWRQQIALVPQRPYLFRGTVRDNIRLARPDAGDDEVARAAELAGCLPFIADLSDGFDTVIGEQGDGLSAGQRQRLAIARALLKDAPLLVLDEPTSALDPESEAAIRRALSLLRRDRTVLVVAHRLNTVRAADRIAVLDGGRLVEVGAHDDLLQRDGPYAALTGYRQPEMATA